MRKILFVVIAVLLMGCCAGTMEAKTSKKKRARRPATEDVWKHISGMYPFSNGTQSITVDYFQGVFKALVKDNPDDESIECGGSVDERTGLITIVDDNGKVIFTGKMYRGGNQLRGKLRGKPVTLEGMCGL